MLWGFPGQGAQRKHTYAHARRAAPPHLLDRPVHGLLEDPRHEQRDAGHQQQQGQRPHRVETASAHAARRPGPRPGCAELGARGATPAAAVADGGPGWIRFPGWRLRGPRARAGRDARRSPGRGRRGRTAGMGGRGRGREVTCPAAPAAIRPAVGGRCPACQALPGARRLCRPGFGGSRVGGTLSRLCLHGPGLSVELGRRMCGRFSGKGGMQPARWHTPAVANSGMLRQKVHEFEPSLDNLVPY